jgi:hypothetical protein
VETSRPRVTIILCITRIYVEQAVQDAMIWYIHAKPFQAIKSLRIAKTNGGEPAIR